MDFLVFFLPLGYSSYVFLTIFTRGLHTSTLQGTSLEVICHPTSLLNLSCKIFEHQRIVPFNDFMRSSKFLLHWKFWAITTLFSHKSILAWIHKFPLSSQLEHKTLFNKISKTLLKPEQLETLRSLQIRWHKSLYKENQSFDKSQKLGLLG
jgi:hypothetical protein